MRPPVSQTSIPRNSEQYTIRLRESYDGPKMTERLGKKIRWGYKGSETSKGEGVRAYLLNPRVIVPYVMGGIVIVVFFIFQTCVR